jgi:dTDP-D-glucose 4,6-dehydratase
MITNALDDKPLPIYGDGKQERNWLPGHDRRYALTCDKIDRELGWKPAISLDDGLRQTIEWYRSNTKWLTEVRRGDYRTYYQKYYENRDSSLRAITESGRKPTS